MLGKARDALLNTIGGGCVKMLEYTRTVVHVKDPQIDTIDINISMLI